MTYTAIGVLAVVIAVLLDLFACKTRMVTRPIFWGVLRDHRLLSS